MTHTSLCTDTGPSRVNSGYSPHRADNALTVPNICCYCFKESESAVSSCFSTHYINNILLSSKNNKMLKDICGSKTWINPLDAFLMTQNSWNFC